jgi:hypothetical protein
MNATRAYSARTLAKGRWLFGVSVVTYAALGLVVGFGPAAFLIGVVAVLAGWFWLARRFPLLAIGLLGFIGGLTGSRSYYRPYFYRRRR